MGYDVVLLLFDRIIDHFTEVPAFGPPHRFFGNCPQTRFLVLEVRPVFMRRGSSWALRHR